MVGGPPANAGDVGLIPGPGEQLGPCATARSGPRLPQLEGTRVQQRGSDAAKDE